MQTKHPINFVWGKPAPALLPVDQLSLVVQAVLTNPDISTDALEYGDPAGPAALRQQIAISLKTFYHTPNTAEQICITAGSSQGLATELQVLTDPLCTKHVWLVAPCFHSACRIFEDAGFAGKLRALPETDIGLDLDYLESAMLELEQEDENKHKNHQNGIVRQPRTKPEDIARKTYTHVIYLVPSFSNPSSRTVPLSDRYRLVSLARRFDALLVSDDIYDYLSYSAGTSADPSAPPLLPRLVDIDRSLPTLPTDPHAFGHAVSNGSFSKLICPGIRTGWVSGSPVLINALSKAGASIAGGCPSQFSAAVVAEFLATGQLEPHVKTTLLPAYTRRRRIMADAIHRELKPLGAWIVEDGAGREGGYFLWLKLPDNVDGEVVAQKCIEAEALAVLPGKLFEVVGDKSVALSPYLRLCFSWADEKDLDEGICRLARIVREVLDGIH